MALFLNSVSKELVVYSPLQPTPSSIEPYIFMNVASKQYLETYKALHIGCRETVASKIIRSMATNCPTHNEKEMAARLSNYNKASSYLNRLTNNQLERLLTTAKPLSINGIGGEVSSLEIENTPVIFKKNTSDSH